MPALPPDLVAGLDVLGSVPVAGGSIAASFRLDTAAGPLFAKTHPRPKPRMFSREAAGLRALATAAPPTIGVPQVVRVTAGGLVLSWIDEGRRRPSTEDELGRGLAHIHRSTAPAFGALDGDTSGYLGSMPIDLTPTASWTDFFLERRLVPLAEAAIAKGTLSPEARRTIDRLAPRADELCGPAEPPSLVHGDLWAGNRLVDTDGRNWLIDPAAHFAHREIDLAMMRLFGGFGPRCFAAYDEAFPLATGWQDRIDWYQVPPLLVHAYLFGGSYGDSALDALRRYL
ncbi:fructosamine kinase family protein [Propionicicella superfundia]|uniref:fructosamine kinase family protein n=1 Tax=Propionicicella superfundia TaxID=348582 RepID=UPI00041AA43B|nr:fructosamine kinase family protein [Propionicicella superfundia]